MPRIKCTTHTATYYLPLTTIPSTYLSRQLYLPVSVTQKIRFNIYYPSYTISKTTTTVEVHCTKNYLCEISNARKAGAV